jgi:hypothetical protein
MRPDNIRLKPRLRASFYAVFAVLFATGAAWWTLHTLIHAEGGADSSVAPILLKAHGAAAMIFLVVLGILYPVHIKRGWVARRNVRSGSVLVALCLLLIITGYLLYYAGGESAREWASRAHGWLGLAMPLIIGAHIWRGRRLRPQNSPRGHDNVSG